MSRRSEVWGLTDRLSEPRSQLWCLGMGWGWFGSVGDDEADAAIRKGAPQTADDRVHRATAAGQARGLGSVKSLMLGSFSRAGLHHSDRAVLVAPSAGLAEQRRHRAEHAQLYKRARQPSPPPTAPRLTRPIP